MTGCQSDSAAHVDTAAPSVVQHAMPLGATDSEGRTPPASFEVASGVHSLVLSVRGPETAMLTLAELTAPDGQAWVPAGWTTLAQPQRTCLSCRNRITTSAAEAAFLLPEVPTLTVTPGTWQVRALAYDRAADGSAQAHPGPLTLTVTTVRRDAHRPQKATLDLNLCLSGALGITAEVALQHPRIQQALADLRVALGLAGISLGQVRTFDIAAPQWLIAHDAGADADLTALFQSAHDLPLGLNVFVVEAIYRAGSMPSVAPIRGLAGGIPGPVLTATGPRTGVAVALQLGPGETDQLGVTMAHELLHYLGLFHVREPPSAGDVTDPLADTPPDDSHNLMFWSPPALDDATLSPQQVQVLYGNPWLQ